MCSVTLLSHFSLSIGRCDSFSRYRGRPSCRLDWAVGSEAGVAHQRGPGRSSQTHLQETSGNLFVCVCV